MKIFAWFLVTLQVLTPVLRGIEEKVMLFDRCRIGARVIPLAISVNQGRRVPLLAEVEETSSRDYVRPNIKGAVAGAKDIRVSQQSVTKCGMEKATGAVFVLADLVDDNKRS